MPYSVSPSRGSQVHCPCAAVLHRFASSCPFLTCAVSSFYSDSGRRKGRSAPRLGTQCSFSKSSGSAQTEKECPQCGAPWRRSSSCAHFFSPFPLATQFTSSSLALVKHSRSSSSLPITAASVSSCVHDCLGSAARLRKSIPPASVVLAPCVGTCASSCSSAMPKRCFSVSMITYTTTGHEFDLIDCECTMMW